MTIKLRPKMLRESLCVAQTQIGQSDDPRKAEHIARLGRLIEECDRHRPLGHDGKHGDRHTSTCGCDRVRITERRRERMSDTPTPIDPAVIRPGDVVDLTYRLTICQVSPGYVISEDGIHWEKDAEDVATTWHLIDRPDPDAEAVEVMAKEWHEDGYVAEWDALHEDTREGIRKQARAALAALREQGWDVVRRAE